jgi:SAM-dependent methyltransferase
MGRAMYAAVRRSPDGHHRPIQGPWPEPPLVDAPFSALDPDAAAVDERPAAYDLALFEALNAEYADRRVATTAPKYDTESVTFRSRGRLETLHSQLGLAGKRVLEVGCGAGYEVWYLANHFHAEAWGVDPIPRRSWPSLQAEHVHLVAADFAGDHGLPLSYFDRAISFTVWEHIRRPQAALEQLFRVLRPGGRAWIRANLYRGPTASHRYRDIYFPFPHLLFPDEVIAEALRRAGGVKVKAAELLGMSFRSFRYYTKKYNLK